jgi:hypothetical protein
MPSIDHPNDRGYWYGISGILAIHLAVLFAVSVAALVYINWSSSAALAEFEAAGRPPISRPRDLPNFSTPIQHAKGQVACPRKA